MKKNKINVLLPSVMVSLSICFLLFLYSPLELLFGNQTEFNYNMYELLRFMLPAALVVLLVLSIILSLLKKKTQSVYYVLLVLLVAVLISSYIQGTFLSGNLPPLDGRTIHWEDYDYQRYISIALWSGAFVLLFLIWKKLGNVKFEKLSAAFSAIMLVMLGVTLALNCLMTGGYHRNKVIVHSDSGLLDMADDSDNFVIFLMDAVDGEKFNNVLQLHPEYRELFEDFTCYSNVTSAYPYTSRSIPFILSGIWYENDISYEAYCKKAFEESPLFQELNLRGYRMGLYDPEFSFVTSLDGKFENVSSESRILYPAQFAAMQLKMTGYRYFPYDFKRICYMTPEQLYLASVKSNGREQYYSMDNEIFLERLKEKEVSYSENACFRYIYVRGAHEPFIYDAQSPQIENSSYESSIEYCVTIAGTYLQKLKTAGVYDNTAIIFLADHGYADDNASFGRQNPMLLVKGIGEEHPFTTSEAPISHEDLQQAYRRLLDGTGGSAVFDWEENTDRERRFLFFEYEKEEHMAEYYQTGHAADETTMVATGRVFDYK